MKGSPGNDAGLISLDSCWWRRGWWELASRMSGFPLMGSWSWNNFRLDLFLVVQDLFYNFCYIFQVLVLQFSQSRIFFLFQPCHSMSSCVLTQNMFPFYLWAQRLDIGQGQVSKNIENGYISVPFEGVFVLWLEGKRTSFAEYCFFVFSGNGFGWQ